MASVLTLLDDLADDIQTGLAELIPGLQVEGRLIPNPTPPVIDIYPADPFTQAIGYGSGNTNLRFTIRARVSTAENEAGQELLLSLMDPAAATSLANLVEQTTGYVVTGPSGFGLYNDPGGVGNNLLGCTWTLEVTP